MTRTFHIITRFFHGIVDSRVNCPNSYDFCELWSWRLNATYLLTKVKKKVVTFKKSNLDGNMRDRSTLLLRSLFILLINTLPSYSRIVRLENDLVALEFNTRSNSLTGLIDKSTDIDLIGYASDIKSSTKSDRDVPILSTDLFELAFVDSSGLVAVSPLHEADSIEREGIFGKEVEIIWKNVETVTTSTILDISMRISLPDDSSLAFFDLSLTLTDGEPLGLWDVMFNINTDGNATAPTGELFFPTGFGYTYLNPLSTASSGISQLYPGGGASFQCMALGNIDISSALYMAAMDSTGSPKLMQYSTMSSYIASTGDSSETKDDRSVDSNMISRDKLPHWRVNDEYERRSVLSITTYPANSGVPLDQGKTWTMPYKIAIGVLSDINPSKGRPIWFEAAMAYRNWAINHAEWSMKGALRHRKEILPSWYRNNNIWVNTHWQCHDIFNTTGGDPSFVLGNTLKVAKRLNQTSLALHWYEWQQGKLTRSFGLSLLTTFVLQGPDPSPEARYLFDTHYPDYFPPRSDFLLTVKELQDRNIHVIPYINGRIFDINSDSYLNDNGDQYCSKLSPTTMIDFKDIKTQLSSYEETYGSNATFCVSSPFTTYWQDKIASVVGELVHKYHVNGVYIDQIGAAVPKLCWESRHHHTLGGGEYWRKGYYAMMQAIRDVTDLKESRYVKSPMVTEDNAEFAIDMMQGFLTLTAFRGTLATSKNGDTVNYKRSVNAFPAIYGGYYVGFGAEWFRADFEDHNWFCGKLSTHFVSGSQLGWFSLVGMANDTADSCGPMGVGDLLLSSSHDDLIDFIKLLSTARGYIVDYFLYGRYVRPPILRPDPPARTQTVSSGGRPLLDYDTVTRAAWMLDADQSILLIFIGSTASSFNTRIFIDMTLWISSDEDETAIQSSSDPSAYLIESLDPSSGMLTEIDRFVGEYHALDLSISGRSIQLYKISSIKL